MDVSISGMTIAMRSAARGWNFDLVVTAALLQLHCACKSAGLARRAEMEQAW